MSVQNLLEIEIQDEFEKLSGMETGKEEYKTTVDGLTKLLDRHIEIDRLKSEIDEKDKSNKDEKIDRRVGYGLTAAGIIIPSLITIWGTVKSLKFEQDGTVTTIMGRGFISKLLPKK